MELNKKILSYMLCYPECVSKCFNVLEDSYFENPLNKLFHNIVIYYQRTRKILTVNIVKYSLEKRNVSLERVMQFVNLMEELLAEKPNINEFDYFLGQFKEECIEKLQRKYLGENENDEQGIIPLIEKKNPIKAHDRMKDVVLKVDAMLRLDKEREGSTKNSSDIQKENYLKAEANPTQVKGVMTGFASIDEATNGLSDDLFIAIGSIGVGKSFLLATIAKNMWQGGHSILYFTLELSKEKIDRRFTAAIGALDTLKIKAGQLNEFEKERYFKALQLQKERENVIYVVDLPRHTSVLTLESIFLKVRDLIKPDAIFIDYLNLLIPNLENDQDARAQGQISAELHELVRQYKIPIVTAVQATSKRHMVARQFEVGHHRIARAEEIGWNADIIMQIVKDDEADYSKQLKFYLTKVREGPQKEFEVYCDWASATLKQGDVMSLLGNAEPEIKKEGEPVEKN